AAEEYRRLESRRAAEPCLEQPFDQEEDHETQNLQRQDPAGTGGQRDEGRANPGESTRADLPDQRREEQAAGDPEVEQHLEKRVVGVGGGPPGIDLEKGDASSRDVSPSEERLHPDQ